MEAILSWLRRRWLLVLVVLAFILFVAFNWNELAGLVNALVQGQWAWVLAALLSQTAYYFLYAVQYKLAFATVEVASQVIEIIPVLFASIFVRTVVPSGGVSGAALFVDDATRRGQSGARAAEGALLVLALDLGTLTPLLLYSLAYLRGQGQLVAYQMIGSIIYLLFVAGLVAALLLGRWSPGLLRGLFDALVRAANWAARRIGRPDFLPRTGGPGPRPTFPAPPMRWPLTGTL